MASPYRADHVGSLLRPPELLQAQADFNEGRTSAEPLAQALALAQLVLLRLQVEIVRAGPSGDRAVQAGIEREARAGQLQARPAQGVRVVEGVARLRVKIAGNAELKNFGEPGEAGVSDAALIAGPVVLTGSQNSFGYEEQDARLAFERLRKALEQAGLSNRDVVYAHYYPLAPVIARQVRTVLGEVFNHAPPPAGSLLVLLMSNLRMPRTGRL